MADILRSSAPRERVALVLSGGGARGAYEAGVLSYLFEEVYPKLPDRYEFDVVSGTSVGAIHAAYVAASAGQPLEERSRSLVETWEHMELDHVLDVSLADLATVPLRALGFGARKSKRIGAGGPELIGGLVDIGPLEKLVETRIPWSGLRANIAESRPGALCVACTEVESGSVTVFIDGPLGDTRAWDFDPYAHAVRTLITPKHVRASAAIPFLFPAVNIDGRYYLDGGLRVNTPLSPALRLGSDKIVVVGLKAEPAHQHAGGERNEQAITQPAFLLGKVLDVLMLDQLESELRHLDVINALLDGATDALGHGCINRINDATREKRGLEYRKVQTVVIRPSADLGEIAADSYRTRRATFTPRGIVPYLLAKSTLSGVPENEADLFSYIFFDSSFTKPLIELGRADAKHQEDELVSMLSAD